MTKTLTTELLSVARAMRDYIDALPSDVVASLPTMPGFDRDWADEAIEAANREAQPVAEYGDAYQGAREDLSIWKRRALEAKGKVRHLERVNDHLVKEAQGEHRMGEPVFTALPAPVVNPEFTGVTAVPDERAAFNAWNNEDNLPISGVPAKNAAWLAWQARAMLAQPVSQGYKLVPVEPTEEMIAAAMNCDDVEFNSDETFCVNFDNIYRAMLAAAPEGGN